MTAVPLPATLQLRVAELVGLEPKPGMAEAGMAEPGLAEVGVVDLGVVVGFRPTTLTSVLDRPERAGRNPAAAPSRGRRPGCGVGP
ncbi:hypothetical protein ACIA8F_15540 [Streptomyces sp. NPDC051563]|uniref:hypothetical protein n=1 Tax=Streptomyces sp. NPDC051563 TaxID=3365659 RepID=UPI0037A795A6